MKLNHNELLTYPNKFDQVMFAHVQQARDMGCAARRRDDLLRLGGVRPPDPGSVAGVPDGPRARHGNGAVVLPAQRCLQEGWRRLPRRRRPHRARRITSASRSRPTSSSRRLPENNGGYNALNFGKTSKLVYSQLTSDHPIDLTATRSPTATWAAWACINSGGASSGDGDFEEAARTAVDQQARRRHRLDLRPQGVPATDGGRREALNIIQDVYLDPAITVA